VPTVYGRGVTSSTSAMTGAVGEVLEGTGDAVVIVDAGRVVAWSPGAAELFGIPRDEALAPGATPLHEHLPALLAVPRDGVAVRMPLAPYGVLEVRHREVGTHQMLLIRDVSVEVRRSEGLRRLSRLSRGLLVEAEPTVSGVLATVAHAAREMTGASSGVVLLLHGSEAGPVVQDGGDEQSTDDYAHLLMVAARARRPLRVADLAKDGAGVALEPPYPPIGPLCAVPLVAGIDLLGALAVSSPTGGRVFDAVDQELLVDLAAHASVGIRWAQGIEKEKERARLRADVVRTARHDIRTPIGAGKGYSSLLLTKADKMSPEQVQMALEGLKQAFERIQAMTDRLLVDEELEVVGATPQWASVALASLLDEVRRDAEVVTGRADAVEVVFEPGAAQTVAGDVGMVRVVVDNLVGNALKHAGHVAPVVVAVLPAGGCVRLEVRDKGPGIAVEDQAALFERWSRLDGTRSSGTAGFGLGLSIVKRLVEAHGGDIGGESAPGEGATFWVTLPTEQPA
jgi:signal transduction histidine kinase